MTDIKPELIDTHAHINFNAFKEDGLEIIRECLRRNIWLINVGTQLTTSKQAIFYGEQFQKGVYASVGLHPLHLKTGLVKIKTDPEETGSETPEESFNYQKYRALANHPKVVAIGEIGLDYWYKPKTRRKQEEFKNKQKDSFIQQLKLSQELNLPVIIHCRLAFNEVLEILQNFSEIKGVFHCFTGSWKEARKILDLGFYLGLNGIIFKKNLSQVIEKMPLKSVLLETDCPYLTPPQVKEKRNSPLNLKYIIEEIAKIRKIPFQEIKKITTQNARELFRI